jgi:hypothetical protein
MTEEAKAKLSASRRGMVPWNKGVPHKDETKEKMRAKKIGIPLSEDHKKKIGESNKGKHENVVHTPEALEANRIAHLGKKASDETKEKMSIAHKGKETWNKGKEMPLGTGDKISKKISGLKRTESTRNKMRGKNNNNWNGGISPFLKTLRMLPEMYEWRSKVMERDDYRDRFTGERGNGDLEAHHIIPFSKLLKIYNIKTVEDALSCKELWDIENGVTMFKDTHMDHHKKYKNSILPKEYYSRKESY